MADNFPDLILNDGSKPLEANKNDYFLVTITNLIPGKTYPVEFRWNYKDPKTKADWGAVLNIVTPAESLPAVTSVTPAWSGTTFTVTFTSNPAASGNENLSYYKITLTGGGVTKVFSLLPRSGTSQVFSLDNPANRANFGVPQNAFSGSVISVDKNGNESTATAFTLTTRTSAMPTPVLTATAINNGYSVSYTTPTQDEYNNIEIEEVESNASTDPGAGYGTVFSGIANPAVVIVPNTNKRWIRARFFDDGGLTGSYSTAVAVTPSSPVSIDTTGPSAPSSGSLTAGIDNSTGATIGFNAFVDISWSAISDSTLRGYRIRFRENGSSNPYSYVDSPGTGTSFRLNGLAIGTTYEISVASYDEFNNVSSSYTSLGTAVATGTPFIGKNVTTTGYFGASATGDTGEFRFGYGVETGRRGLRFDSNNYWYIDSSASASFRLGGSANNYLQWNGGTFTIDGDLTARSGAFRGNVQIISGGSLYSGTVSGSSLVGAGYILNSSGLTFNSSSTNGITTINGSTGLFTTASANIGGWNVNSSQVTKTTSSGTLTLDSTTSQMTVTGYASTSAGIAAPTSGASTDIVFWAGGSRNTSAPFYVRADGFVKSTSAEISGTITASALSIDSNNYWNTAGNLGKFKVGNNSKYLEWNGSDTLNVVGNLNGSSGTFGGVTLNSSGISSTGETGIINFNFSGATSGYLKTLGSGALELASPYSSGQAYLRLWGFAATPAIDLVSSGLGTITINGATALYLRTESSGTIYVDQGNGIDSTRNLTVRGQTTTLGHIYLPNPNIGTGGGIARINLSSSPAGRLISETGSSQRYKNNIVDIIDVENLNPYNLLNIPVKAFKFNSNYISEDDERYDKFVPGFIAEEVDQHYPIAVDHSGGVAERWNPSFIIPGMLALIQNLNQELISIKSRLDALEG